MKWLIALLLFITTAGTFTPCCLLDDGCDEQVTAASDHNNHQPKSTCSPFSACAACSGFVALLKYVEVIQPVVNVQVHDERMILLHLPAYASSCWQPPRSC